MRRFVRPDLMQINCWLELRDKKPLRLADLPAVGFIVEDTAVGFLYQTDSNTAYIETFISNPTAKHIYSAMDDITKALITYATDHGFKRLLGVTQHNTIKELANKHNFIYSDNYALLSKQLK